MPAFPHRRNRPGHGLTPGRLSPGLLALALFCPDTALAQSTGERETLRDRFDIGATLGDDACRNDPNPIKTGDSIDVCVAKPRHREQYRLPALPNARAAPTDGPGFDRHHSIAAESPCARDGHAGCPAPKIVIFSTSFQ